MSPKFGADELHFPVRNLKKPLPNDANPRVLRGIVAEGSLPPPRLADVGTGGLVTSTLAGLVPTTVVEAERGTVRPISELEAPFGGDNDAGNVP